MKFLNFLMPASVLASLVSGPAVSAPTIAEDTAASSSASARTVVFFNGIAGQAPESGLIAASDGNYYGTTFAGGKNSSGEVYRLTKAGLRTTLHAFDGVGGYLPYSMPVEGPDGDLYGTTYEGGTGPTGGGVVYRLSKRGQYTVLHNFQGGTDGWGPEGGLILGQDGNFYGAASGGGSSPYPDGYGVIYRITPSGDFTVLHTFVFSDGGGPRSTLVQASDGTFYGTTEGGGPLLQLSHGTVFKITPSGEFTMLTSFDASTINLFPYGLSLGPDGNLYGGSLGNANLQAFAGTIFRITPQGELTTLHVFKGGPDGASSYAPLRLGHDGMFYGVTQAGGNKTNAGTFFRMTLDGTVTTLYNFDYVHGADPLGELLETSPGVFLGTSYDGGYRHQGVVFQLTLQP